VILNAKFCVLEENFPTGYVHREGMQGRHCGGCCFS